MTNPDGPRERSAVLVAGMHRSGTSVFTHLVGILGAELPEEMIPSGPDNPEGFFESARLVSYTKDVMASFGQDWVSLAPMDDWPAHLAAHPEQIDELGRLVTEDYGDATRFVLKDPRCCRLIPLLRDGFAAADADTIVLLPFRHPLEVARSLETRNAISLSLGLAMWLRYALDAERDSRDLPRSFAAYEDVLADPAGVFVRIAEQSGFADPAAIEGRRAEIEEIVHPTSRHHAENSGFGSEQPWLAAAYAAYQALAVDPLDADAMAALDQVRADFDNSAPLLAAFERDHDAQRQELATTRRENRQLSRKNEKVQTALDNNRRTLKETRAEVKRLRGRIKEIRGNHQITRAELESLREQLARTPQARARRALGKAKRAVRPGD